MFFKIVTDDLVDVNLIKMAAHVKLLEMPKKSKKRKSKERLRESKKKQRLASHKSGLECNCKRLKCFEIVKREDRIFLLSNSQASKDTQDSYLAS